MSPNAWVAFLAASAVMTAPGTALAQEPKPIFDGRLTLKPTPLSTAEETLLKSRILPAARKHWHEREEDQTCGANPDSAPLDMAPGSFTEPSSSQKAILYRYCTLGHDLTLEGIAIIEGDRVAAHIVYHGGNARAIGALPDVNGNGLAEILTVAGGTHQGITISGITIIEIIGRDVTSFGMAGTFSDDCGVDENHCKVTANRILVKPGPKPEFFQEQFVQTGTTWKRSGVRKAITLEDDDIGYEFIH